MALATSDSFSSFDTTTGKLDLSPVLAAVLVSDTAFLGLVGLGQSTLKADHRFNEDSLNPATVTGNEAAELSATDTTLTVTDGSKIRIGTLLMDEAAGKTEILQVTAISTNDLTVVRGYGSSDGETHASDATFAIVGQPVQEGDETITDISADRTQRTQYQQIFKRTVKISGTREAEAANGQDPGSSSELQLQILRRMMEMKVELNRAALNSVISAAGSDTVYRSMKGLREYLTVSGGNNTSTTETLSEKVVNKMYRDAWDDGGMPDNFVGRAEQFGQFAGFNASKVRVAPSDRIAGVFVNKYLTELGAELTLNVDRFFRKDEAALIEKKRCWMAPLQGRGLVAEPLAKIGDALRYQVLMEITLIVQNANKAHAYHTNLNVPS